MNPLIVIELIKQAGKFGGSLRKELIGVGVMPPIFLSAYTTIQERCIESCTFQEAVLSLSGQQWWGVIGVTSLMVLHLNQKRKDDAK